MNKKSSFISIYDDYTAGGSAELSTDYFANNTLRFAIHATGGLSNRVLQSCNLNGYLTDNLTYDVSVSEQVKNEVLRTVSQTEGLVQTGERVIDKGDLVTESSYRVLTSLQIAMNKMQGEASQSWIILLGEILIVTGLMRLIR